MNRFVVGYTILDNTPCIIVDGDSVFAVFPSIPNGEQHADVVCRLLNAAEALGEYH